jgi:drug/metabolite transporter (DMT)-like permease
MFALKHLMPTLVSYYIYLQPIIASIIAYSLGGEKLGIAQLIAAVLIVSGVVLVNRSGMKKQLKDT